MADETYEYRFSGEWTQNYIDLGVGIDTASYEALADNQYLEAVIGGPNSDIQVSPRAYTRPTPETWQDSPMGSDYLNNVEILIGSDQPDEYYIVGCEDYLQINGGQQNGIHESADGILWGYGDTLRLGQNIGPVEWQISPMTDSQDTFSGSIRGSGLYVEFEDIEILEPRPSDSVNGIAVDPEQGQSSGEEYLVCPAVVSEFLTDAETELAALRTPNEVEQEALSALRDSHLASRVMDLAEGGVENLSVPINSSQEPIVQVLEVANAAEQQVLAHEASLTLEQNIETPAAEAADDYMFG